MSEDLVERLRDKTGYWHEALRNEAATEIKSLRARVQYLEATETNQVASLRMQLGRARADVIEECAKIADQVDRANASAEPLTSYIQGRSEGAQAVAAAIRAIGGR